MTVIISTLIVSAVLALLLGFLLGFFKKFFHVEVDPLVGNIRAELPGANCGACGYPGCDGLAAAIAAGNAAPNSCTVGGAPVAQAVGKLLGVESTAVSQVVVLACQGTKERALLKGVYNGVKNCRAAKSSIGGMKFCQWGCIGFGDCVNVCRFDALHLGEDGIPHVDYTKCTGCGMCANTCPQKILSKTPVDRNGAVPLCSNRNPVKSVILKNCKIGCIKCEKCVKTCPKKAIAMYNGIPQIDYTLCDSCGECIKACPTKVLKLLETIEGK